MDKYRQNNLSLWNEWVKINAASNMYGLEQFKQGECKLNPLEIEELGDVQGKSLLHLQCHFGMDTLSWARLGVTVTGVDFSDKAIRFANDLSKELNLPARFLCSDIYDLPQHLNEQFDIVFTSYGVLTWLSDIPAWAKLVARYLKPGGVFYIAEFHPFAMMFDDAAAEPILHYPYFDKLVCESEVQGSYADISAHTDTKVAYEWPYTMGEIVTSLVQAGLSIEYLHEFPFSVYPAYPFLIQQDEHYWVQPQGKPEIPLLFTIRANKPL